VFWFLIQFTDSFLREASGAGLLSAGFFGPGTLGAIRFALAGLGLMLLMIFRPQGILGDRREMELDA
jgi:neutral amino acid transport system permease protein